MVSSAISGIYFALKEKRHICYNNHIFWHTCVTYMKGEYMREKKKEVKKVGLTLPLRILATGALVAMLTSMAPAPVSSYSASNDAGTRIAVEDARSKMPGVSYHGDKVTYSLPGIPSRNLYYYDTQAISVNGTTLGERGAFINGIYCIPVRAYFTALGATVSYNSSTKTMTVRANGLNLSLTDGGFVIYANDRPIFNFTPNIVMSNGRMYASLSSLMKITGQRSAVSGGRITIDGVFSPLAPATRYYRDDEVFWLARIITAEARGESLIGQIAVGNVIMNRVSSPLYPNTIYGVIFDRKWGVQFSPILDGSIYNTPTYTATLAAKIILEGTRLSSDSLFFLNPVTAESSWIVKSREYLYTIGGHDFYA